MSKEELTFDKLPFLSTARGVSYFTGIGSDFLLHRQQRRLWRSPLLRAFFEGEAWISPGTWKDREKTHWQSLILYYY